MPYQTALADVMRAVEKLAHDLPRNIDVAAIRYQLMQLARMIAIECPPPDSVANPGKTPPCPPPPIHRQFVIHRLAETGQFINPRKPPTSRPPPPPPRKPRYIGNGKDRRVNRRLDRHKKKNRPWALFKRKQRQRYREAERLKVDPSALPKLNGPLPPHSGT